MDPPYIWSSCTSDTGTVRLSTDEFPVDTGSRAGTRNGSSSYSSLVLDSERGELVKANVRLQRKGVSVERSVAASKNHIEAERKRRRRINGHLDTLRTLLPGAKKMDKATLLSEVIDRLKQLQKNATEANEGFLIPTDIDEVRVERQEDRLDGAPHSIRASLCCDYKPGLLSNLRQALDALHLILVKAEIATLGDRMKNVIVMAGCKEKNIENTEVCQSRMSSVHQALQSVLHKFSASDDFLLGARLSNKRRRISLFNSSLST
ncbi:hypothetical protein ACOSP7_002229 [Xanthoceras sorbifolium]|uniref:BHLH domain-containing protein n=1 Tax=Xanthoceras sorbifolium TaxID=99658 RepID=A0ABQ8IK50_9ROSI|nr:hypothetical protein JRO89_XS01G0195800 [Xanthoceras sorbifolium]